MTGTEFDARRAGAFLTGAAGGGGGGGGEACFFGRGLGLGTSFSIIRHEGKVIYLSSRWHLLNLLIKHFLYMFTHDRYRMVRAIERETVLKDEANVGNKLVRTVVPGILKVGIWLGRVGGGQLSLYGGKIHGVLDNLRIMGNIKSNRVDWSQEWPCILHFLQRANRR
jgi:hypothetical protein